jgi:hypothetical protein
MAKSNRPNVQSVPEAVDGLDFLLWEQITYTLSWTRFRDVVEFVFFASGWME